MAFGVSYVMSTRMSCQQQDIGYTEGQLVVSTNGAFFRRLTIRPKCGVGLASYGAPGYVLCTCLGWLSFMVGEPWMRVSKGERLKERGEKKANQGSASTALLPRLYFTIVQILFISANFHNRNCIERNWRVHRREGNSGSCRPSLSASIFSLKHESSIFGSVIQPCMWFLDDGTG